MYVYIRTGVATVWEFRTYIYVRKSERVKSSSNDIFLYVYVCMHKRVHECTYARCARVYASVCVGIHCISVSKFKKVT